MWGHRNGSQGSIPWCAHWIWHEVENSGLMLHNCPLFMDVTSTIHGMCCSLPNKSISSGTFQSHCSWRWMTEMPEIAIRMPLNLSTCGWCIGSSTIDVHCKYIFYLCFICAEGNFIIEIFLIFWSRPSSYIKFAIFSSSLLSFHLILLQYHWDWTFYCVGILSFTELHITVITTYV